MPAAGPSSSRAPKRPASVLAWLAIASVASCINHAELEFVEINANESAPEKVTRLAELEATLLQQLAKIKALEGLLDDNLRRAPVPPAPPKMSDYEVDESNPLLYKNGGHRRPTDPATPDEIVAAQTLLFGPEKLEAYQEASDLLLDPLGWGAIDQSLPQVAETGGLDPANVKSVNKFTDCPEGSLSSGHAVEAFEEDAESLGYAAAVERIQGDILRKCNLKWWRVKQVATLVPDREHVIAYEAALDAGESTEVSDLGKIVGVRLEGGYTLVKDGLQWSSSVWVPVDVSDLSAPFVVPRYLEVYRKSSKPIPKAVLSSRDEQYLLTAAMALYNLPNMPYLVSYNGDAVNLDGNLKRAATVKQFTKPYAWKLGESGSSVYGAEEGYYVSNAHILQASFSTLPLDAYQLQTGTGLYPFPLTMQFEVAPDSSRVPTAEATLLDSSAIGLCWYGRALWFDDADAALVLEATSAKWDPSTDNSTLAELTAQLTGVLSAAIYAAWGDEEAVAGSGFRPGLLSERPADGVTVPKLVLVHSYDTPTYINHATPTTMSDWESYADPVTGDSSAGLPFRRDVRGNLPHMAPPLDHAGAPRLSPNGKPRLTVEPHGPSFSLDGYAVTYTAGLTWKFLLAFDPDAGLSLYHIRLVLPPSQAHPTGKEIPYIYRASVPNFGTDYSSSGTHGNLYGANFLEDHFIAGTSVAAPGTCKGLALPVFRSANLAYSSPVRDYEIFYSTLFPTYMDDGSGAIQPLDPFGFDMPVNAFPVDRELQKNGIIAQAICLQEEELTHGSMWHMYTAQDLRGLSVSMSTISEAYNMVVRYNFKSDGKMKVGQQAHGKPAIQMHGIPGFGGAYASDGRGGFASNHLHWAVVNLEPHLLGAEHVELQAHDLVPPEDNPSDWYGLSWYFSHSPVTATDQAELLTYDHAKQRAFLISARDGDGSVLGNLKLTSPSWGVHIKAGNGGGLDAGLPPDQTYLGSRWWLHGRDVWVVNATGRRDSTVLLAQPTSTSTDGTKHPLLQPGMPTALSGSPSIFLVLKMVHDVTNDELPVQNGFSVIETEITPKDLFGFNPNILVRYDPQWPEFMSANPFYTLASAKKPYRTPYESQFESKPGDTSTSYCATDYPQPTAIDTASVAVNAAIVAAG